MSRSLGHDPAYDSPGDLRTILASLKLIGLSLVVVLIAAAIPLRVPGLWGSLFLLLWAATLAGALWGGWRAGVAVLAITAATLFNVPLILGEGGARYVVWDVGARALAAGCSAWMAGWLLRRRRHTGLLHLALILLTATGLATLIVFWLQRGSAIELLPVTLLGLVVASPLSALLVRAASAMGIPGWLQS